MDLSPARDAELRLIGRIRTPRGTREECLKQGDPQGPECRVNGGVKVGHVAGQNQAS